MFEEEMRRWRELEAAACDAEVRLARMGQAAACPEAAELSRRAAQSRRQADELFAAILLSLQDGASRRRA